MDVYGGFSGSEEARWQREWRAYVTILSGDINEPNDANDNSFHVVVGADDALLDGFAITAGNADGNYSGGDYYGGGISCVSISPTIRNCVITGNFGRYGGGMYLEQSGPAVINCTFADNAAELRGGAIYNWEDYYGSFALRVTNCVFSGNKSEDGGGIYNNGFCPTIINCAFGWNSAGSNGGGMYNDGSDPNVINCAFWDNSAVGITYDIFRTILLDVKWRQPCCAEKSPIWSII